MKTFLGGAIIGVLALTALVFWFGAVSLTWPWSTLPELGEVEVALAIPTEARIASVEPVTLDCRARVHVEVPVEGRREHSVFGQVYRTDTVTMHAIGDVDTCVEGTSAQVIQRRDGSTEVVIPGESIRFVRPRVDAVATADSVEVEKGFTGKITDIFPWVSDNLGLTPLAYAYAQNVIGGSDCMQSAYGVTEDLLAEAYRQQFIDQGLDPDQLTVRIEGEPTFEQPLPLELGDGVAMTVSDGEVACVLSADLGGGPATPRR